MMPILVYLLPAMHFKRAVLMSKGRLVKQA